MIIVNRGQGRRRFQVPGSNAAKLLVQSSNALKRVQGCPQEAAELQVQGSNAAELLVQSSNALPRVENCRVASERCKGLLHEHRAALCAGEKTAHRRQG